MSKTPSVGRPMPPTRRELRERRAQLARRIRRNLLIVAALLFGFLLIETGTAGAQPPTPTVPTPTEPQQPNPTGDDSLPGDSTTATDDDNLSIDVNLDSATGEDGPSRSVMIILTLTVLAVAPSLLIMMTSFTRMVVVLSLTRNAIGLQTIPPNQVVVGLALFLSLFVMGPTLKEMNDEGLQPYLNGEISQSEGLDRAEDPLKEFMLANTRQEELGTMISARGDDMPDNPEDLSLITIIPAFVLSELKAAFITGLVIFIPFLVIDLVVSATLMSLGMMMLPPVFVSMPFKILLFVMVDGWALVAESLLRNYH